MTPAFERSCSAPDTEALGWRPCAVSRHFRERPPSSRTTAAIGRESFMLDIYVKHAYCAKCDE